MLRRAALVVVGLVLLSAFACSEETSTGGGGAGAIGGAGGQGASATGSSTTSGGASSTTSAQLGGGGSATGGSGTGGHAAVESCDEIPAPECFSNYDCPDTSTRCENRGTVDWPVACCVTGARGSGQLGEPCASENDCASSLCLEVEPSWLCSDQCEGEQGCVTELPDCVTIPTESGAFSFCSP